MFRSGKREDANVGRIGQIFGAVDGEMPQAPQRGRGPNIRSRCRPERFSAPVRRGRARRVRRACRLTGSVVIS